MELRLMKGILAYSFLFGATSVHAQKPKWLTPEILHQMGIEMCNPCFPAEAMQPITVGKGRITAVTTAYFDTTATYAQGRVVDLATGKPIAGAIIQTRYTCWEGCDVKTAATNKAGFFQLGWVGCRGISGPRSNRPLIIKAPGHQTVSTEAIGFGGKAYLHIELATLPKPH